MGNATPEDRLITPPPARVINPVALRTIRELRRYTLRDLADRSGQDAGYLSRLERAEKRGASEAVIDRFADALHVHIDAITCPDPGAAPPRPAYSVTLTDEQVTQILADHAALGGAA